MQLWFLDIVDDLYDNSLLFSVGFRLLQLKGNHLPDVVGECIFIELCLMFVVLNSCFWKKVIELLIELKNVGGAEINLLSVKLFLCLGFFSLWFELGVKAGDEIIPGTNVIFSYSLVILPFKKQMPISGGSAFDHSLEEVHDLLVITDVSLCISEELWEWREDEVNLIFKCTESGWGSVEGQGF